MTVKILDKPRAGAGAAKKRSRYAWLYLRDDILAFPKTDAGGVSLVGNIILKEDAEPQKVYLTVPSQEYSFESSGDKDSRGFKVKFFGTHPGSETQALEFTRKFMDRDFIVLVPERNGKMAKCLGTYDMPLTFRSSHKSNKDGSKFDFTFEQELQTDDVYLIYTGEMNYSAALREWNPLEEIPAAGIYSLQQNVGATVSEGTLAAYTQPGEILILKGEDNALGNVSRITSGSKILLRKNIEWKSLQGATLALESFIGTDGVPRLIEISRS